MNINEPPLHELHYEDSDLKKINRRAFITGGVLAAGTLATGIYINTMREDMMMPWLLRKVTDFYDGIWKATFNPNMKSSPIPPATGELRVNGEYGLEEEIDESTWRMLVKDPNHPVPLSVSIEDIKKLPSVVESFEFKCIEGWSQPVTCKGVRFSDFMIAYNIGYKDPAGNYPYAYAGLTSINDGYYVSMDMKSLLHPQTLLCYEMNGQPLSVLNGAPLRLASAVKYGVKQIKQIGSIEFSDTMPKDFWAEQGYGKYLGL